MKNAENRTFATVEELNNAIDSFDYEVRTWQEACEELHLDEIGFTEEEFNKELVYMNYDQRNDGWLESVGWEKSNIGEISEISSIDAQTVLEVFNKASLLGKVFNIVEKNQF